MSKTETHGTKTPRQTGIQRYPHPHEQKYYGLTNENIDKETGNTQLANCHRCGFYPVSRKLSKHGKPICMRCVVE